MSQIPTPNYILMESYTWGGGYGSSSEQKTLPAGAFVRPIEEKYVPQHVLDKNLGFNPKTEVYAYTRYGIVPIPKKFLRQV